jgi:flagellum-specific ATP synthase
MSDGELVGRVSSAAAALIVVEGLGRHVCVGSRLTLEPAAHDPVLVEVVRVDSEKCSAMPISAARGVRVGDRAVVQPWAVQQHLAVSPSWLGRVVGPGGEPTDGQGALGPGSAPRPLRSSAIPATDRLPLGPQMAFGIKAVDLFVPCRFGQRLGVFAGTGVGKSSLMARLAAQAEFDVLVVALIGERGREVKELIGHLAEAGQQGKSVVVVATSDMTGFEKRDAALVAVTIAEHFRDQGRKVLLLFDSISRFCDALREVALAGGELPSAMGFPPSVFQNLAQLLERVGPAASGHGEAGYITGVFTTLLDGAEEVNPVADAVRGMLDGHIFLSRRLANRGHYPAIDVMSSISRCGAGLFSVADEDVLRRARAAIGAHEEAHEAMAAGLYRKGQSVESDQAIDAGRAVMDFLRQGREEVPVAVRASMQQLHALMSG